MKPAPRWVLREAGEGDRAAILALRQRVFAAEDPEKLQPEFWDWEFLSGPEGRARMFVADAAGLVAGHYAMIPQDFVFNGTAAKGAIVVDLMTHPDYRRQGIFNRVDRFARDATAAQLDFACAYPIRKESLGGFITLGWKLEFTIPVLVRPLDWSAIARRFGVPLGSAIAAGALPWRGLRKLFAPSLRGDESVRELTVSDCEAMAALATRGLAGMDVHRQRSAAFFRWRLFDSPVWKYRVTGLFQHGILRAFVASRRASLLGTDSLALVDLAAEPEADRELAILLDSLMRDATTAGQAVAGAMVTRGNRYSRALRRAGFYPGPHKFSLILASESPVFQERASAARSWYLSWADTDGV